MDKILEALGKLDVNNDEHWTADGAPRMDAVESIAGEKFTRDDVKAAAPKFNRHNPELTATDETTEEVTQQPAQPWAQAEDKPEMTGDNEPAEQANPADYNVVSEAKQEPVSPVDPDVKAKAQARVEAALAAMEEVRKELDAANAEMDAIVMQEAQVASGANQAANIQVFQRQQQEARQKKMQQSRLLAELVNGSK